MRAAHELLAIVETGESLDSRILRMGQEDENVKKARDRKLVEEIISSKMLANIEEGLGSYFSSLASLRISSGCLDMDWDKMSPTCGRLWDDKFYKLKQAKAPTMAAFIDVDSLSRVLSRAYDPGKVVRAAMAHIRGTMKLAGYRVGPLEKADGNVRVGLRIYPVKRWYFNWELPPRPETKGQHVKKEVNAVELKAADIKKETVNVTQTEASSKKPAYQESATTSSNHREKKLFYPVLPPQSTMPMPHSVRKTVSSFKFPQSVEAAMDFSDNGAGSAQPADEETDSIVDSSFSPMPLILDDTDLMLEDTALLNDVDLGFIEEIIADEKPELSLEDETTMACEEYELAVSEEEELQLPDDELTPVSEPAFTAVLEPTREPAAQSFCESVSEPTLEPVMEPPIDIGSGLKLSTGAIGEPPSLALDEKPDWFKMELDAVRARKSVKEKKKEKEKPKGKKKKKNKKKQ